MAARFDNTDGRLRGRGLQQRRLRKWTQAGGLCAKCQALTEYADPRANPKGFHLDHIKHLDKSKDDSEENTQVLCEPCHLAKTAKDLGHCERVAIGSDGWPVSTGGRQKPEGDPPWKPRPTLFFHISNSQDDPDATS